MHNQSETNNHKGVNVRALILFFLPLGFSASLVTVSHVIINSTLARAANPTVIIASYSIAMSLFAIFERNALVLRPTAAKLIHDRVSFWAVSRVALIVLLTVLALSLTIAYSSIGKWVFSFAFGAEGDVLQGTVGAFRVLLFVTVFSIIRCLFQGIIISNLRTKWMTIGMVVRLVAMAGVAWLFLWQGWVTHAYIGSIIFLIGMFIEALVSTFEGIQLLKNLKVKKREHPVRKSIHVWRFYSPLLLASFIAVLIMPSINATLGWSEKGALAVASFAVAWSVTQLILSFTTYMHQIVLNFYRKDAKKVLRFAAVVNVLPALFLISVAATPLGSTFMQQIMGLTDELLVEGLKALNFLILYALVFPWLDFCHGIVMSHGDTRILAFTQACNVLTTWLTLGLMVFFFSSLGGPIGSIAIGVGFLTELLLLIFFLNDKKRRNR